MAEPNQSLNGNRTIVRPASLSLSSLRLTFGIAGRLAPGLTARWAASLFLRTRRFPPDARERQALASGRRLHLQSSGQTLAGWSWGSGPPVVLVHGWEGRGSQLGAFAAPLAAAGYQAVAFDAPGHGASPGDRSSLVAIARGLEGVAEACGPLAGVVAHSAGAVAATFAISRGLPVQRAVFIAPGTDLEDYARMFASLLGLAPRVVGLLRQRIEREIGVTWREIEPLRLAPSMATPLLVMADSEDRQTPVAGARELAQAWPGARLETTQGLGHHRILWDPGVIQAAIDFLLHPSARSGESQGACLEEGPA